MNTRAQSKEKEANKMKVLQVKEYNEQVAQSKWDNCNKTKCVPSMFFFYLENDYNRRYGLNVRRERGYIAFDEHRAFFVRNKEEARKLLTF